MLSKFFPWKFFLKRLSQAHGFLDPLSLLARFNSFAQPAENVAPSELLRAGAVMHGRGLLNSQAIQHNLDWVWPYWVNEQFSPVSKSFIPRAFAITHINLNHRNWTAVGVPGMENTPIVDPRGLFTPFFDGWSVDCWILNPHGDDLVPARSGECQQYVTVKESLAVETQCTQPGLTLKMTATAGPIDGREMAALTVSALSEFEDTRLVISVRPYNPEGVSYLESVHMLDQKKGWSINKKRDLYWDPRPSFCAHSAYGEGDVYTDLAVKRVSSVSNGVHCPLGMATAAAVYPLKKKETFSASVQIPLQNKKEKTTPSKAGKTFEQYTAHAMRIEIPDKDIQRLYENALHTLLLHSPGDIYAGPYTYHRFWFRDAVLIGNALLGCGLGTIVERAIGNFAPRQRATGYYVSQDGEWDANGQVLWLYEQCARYGCNLSLEKRKHEILKAADWLCRKRGHDHKKSMHQGLLPAGFSAEHFGPNDYYYWDDFWGVAGLKAASRLMKLLDEEQKSTQYAAVATELFGAIENSLKQVALKSGDQVMPVSPYRRPDSASVGNLVASFPLQLFRPHDPRLIETAEFLFSNCTIDHALFHDISHSGINPYLTLHLAQTMLRAGDTRYVQCMKAIADLASPTGQWPEAIHPQLKTGCMGDGQHVWAAAEWANMIRGVFLREEVDKKEVVLCPGILPEWFSSTKSCSVTNAPFPGGTVDIQMHPEKKGVRINWQIRGDEADLPTFKVDPLWGQVESQSGSSCLVTWNEKR